MKRSLTNKLNVLILVSLVTLTSCEDMFFHCLRGNGILVKEERTLHSFTGIVSEGDFDVSIIIDSVYYAVIEADENLLPYISTVVRGDKLIINTSTKRCLRTYDDQPILITVHLPAVHLLNLSGSGYIFCQDLIYVDNIKIELMGSGAIHLSDVDALDIDVLLSGSGEVEIWGICETGDLDITGSGVIKAYHLEQDECYASISGSGDMYVFVYDYLDVNISGSGNIFYRGDPRIRTHITGSGNIINNNK